MNSFSVPNIFWITIIATTTILSVATIVGRAVCNLLPYRYKAHAKFYQSPSLGLACLIIFASLMGRILPFNHPTVTPIGIGVLLIGAILYENQLKNAIVHSFTISAFGLVCGISVMAPLLMYGAFNAHNDAFTYLAHSNWLQNHAFGGTIGPDSVTPFTTQVYLYQQCGFRMGGSFLLALFQGLFGLQWSYEIYPSVTIAAITACCLAIGFPLAGVLHPMRRAVRMALLCFPAFTLGGLTFGANMGFLPQVLGLATGASLLFMSGPLLGWVATVNTSRNAIVAGAIPSALLLTGAVFAYSELSIFLIAAFVGSGVLLAFRLNTWKRILIYSSLVVGISVLLLNNELLRAYNAIRIQSGVVVGSPVDWPLIGFVAHGMGIHGGAWDGFQWTLSQNAYDFAFFMGLLLFGVSTAVLIFGIRSIWRLSLNGVLMPPVVLLTLFGIAGLYFRYAVDSPFPVGTGQSWSQFKLSEWAHPFVMALLLFSIATLQPRMGKRFSRAVIALFTIGWISSSVIGVARTQPMMNQYEGVRDINRFYLTFRESVLATCSEDKPVYLALTGKYLKLRQMAVLYLPDRQVTSDWTDDVYIVHHLPIEDRSQQVLQGSCIVEPNTTDGWLSNGVIVGPFRVGTVDRGKIQITSVDGSYGRESDGQNWWHWVERKVVFKLDPSIVPTNVSRTKLSIEYGTIGEQSLTLRLKRRNGATKEILLTGKGYPPVAFDTIVDLAPADLLEISIETDGVAQRLGEHDSRLAAFIIRNINIIPVMS